MSNFLDTFTAANGTRIDSRAADSGHTYSTNDSYLIQNNQCYATSAGGGEQVIQILTSGGADYISASQYDIEFDYDEVTNNDDIGIWFAASDTSNLYMLRIRFDQLVSLFTKVAGSYALIDSYALSGTELSAGTVKAEVRTSSITVFVDSNQVFTTSNTDHARAGRFYYRAGSTSTSDFDRGWHFDRVALTSLNAMSIDTAPTTLRSVSTNTATISGSTATPTTLNTTVKIDGSTGVSGTVTGVTDNGDSTYDVDFTFARTTARKFDATGYTLYIDVDGENAETAAIPYVPQTGYDYIDVASPDTGTDVYTQYSGGTFVTNDQLVWDASSGLDFSADTNYITPGALTATIYRIAAAGTVDVEDTITFTLGSGAGIISDLVTDMVTDLVTEMVN